MKNVLLIAALLIGSICVGFAQSSTSAVKPGHIQNAQSAKAPSSTNTTPTPPSSTPSTKPATPTDKTSTGTVPATTTVPKQAEKKLPNSTQKPKTGGNH